MIPLLLFIPGMMSFPYPSSQASFSDISITHYPYTLYLRETLFSEHRLPLWNPLILSGHPFAANPLSGLWYPPGWLALVLPLPFAFNFLVVLHLLIGGLGLYGLLRSEGLRHQPALFAALLFEALPKIFAHYGAGHLTLLYAVPWTPWLLWASRDARRSVSNGFFWQEAAILSLIFMADARWSLYAGLVWCAYVFAYRPFSQQLSRSVNIWHNTRHVLLQCLFTILLVAPFLLPFVEFTRYSSRSQMSGVDISSFSLPLGNLLGFFFPNFSGFHEWMLYTGAVGVSLVLLLLVSGQSNPRQRFWLWCLCLSLLFSLGSTLPFFGLIARIPIVNLLRVPTRALFLTGLCIAILSGYSIQLLQEPITMVAQRRMKLALTGLLGFVLSLALAVWFFSGEIRIDFQWGAIFFWISGMWILARLRSWLNPNLWLIGLFVICLIDLSAVDRSLFSPRSINQTLAEGEEVANWLASQHGLFRTYSPSYSLPQQIAAAHDLQLTDGVDPLQLASYVQFMQPASGVPNSGYSVTLPPFEHGLPATDNVDYRPDLALLGLLNVHYLLAEYDLEVAGLELLQQFDDTRLYTNKLAYPRAWMAQSDGDHLEDIYPQSIQSWNSDRILIKAHGRGLLVLSELAYPGWEVRVNGQARELERAYGILRAVRLDELGTQQVEFIFRPASIFFGLLLSGITMIILTIYVFLQRKR